MPPSVVSDALAKLFAHALVLDAEETAALPGRLAASGVRGGATYDGVIALTARHHRAVVLTLDGRSARTYQALDVEFELLGS